MLVGMLHSVLQRAGINPTHCKSHSFRIGVGAAALGNQDSFIQKMGHWSSLAFLAYVRTPDMELASVFLVKYKERSTGVLFYSVKYQLLPRINCQHK